MFLDIKDLELHPSRFRGGVSARCHRSGRRGPAADAAENVGARRDRRGASRQARVIKDIRLRGQLSAGLELHCARCLDPVAQDIEREFDLLYRPLGADAGRDELSVTDAEAEIGYYQGDGFCWKTFCASRFCWRCR